MSFVELATTTVVPMRFARARSTATGRRILATITVVRR